MVREATLADYEAIAALDRQVFGIHKRARPDIMKQSPFNREFLKECLEDECRTLFVYEENNHILGHCLISVYDYHNNDMYHDMIICHIDSMCVDESARGKQIGRLLFDRAKEYAGEINADRLELMVWAFNEDARRFYEKLGMHAKHTQMEMKLK